MARLHLLLALFLCLGRSLGDATPPVLKVVDDPVDIAEKLAPLMIARESRLLGLSNVTSPLGGSRRQARQDGSVEEHDEESAEDSELTEEERLEILRELEKMNSTELEELPTPEMFVSHVRDYWRRQEAEKRRIRNEILDIIVPRGKRKPPPRGPPPQGVPGPPPPLPPRANQRADRPPPGRRHRPKQRDQVIGHQLPPPPPGRRKMAPPEQRSDVQEAQASKPALAPFLFKVPGEGVIQLPPPPSHATEINTSVFPPPFPVGVVPPAKRPHGPGHHGNRRRGPGPNKEPPRRPPPNHPPPRHQGEGRRPSPDRRPRPERRRPPPGADLEQRRRQEQLPLPPPPRQAEPEDFVQPPFAADPSTVDSRPFDLGPPDTDPFRPSNTIADFGVPNFTPFNPVFSNDIGVGRRECDFYSEDICLESDVYPQELIARSLSVERPLTDAMFAEVREQNADVLVEGVSSRQEERYDYTHYFGSESRQATERQGIGSHSHRDFAQDGGYLCPSEVKYARPKRAKNSKGEWKFIVNMDRYTQTLRMEKCMRPGGSCSYVSHHYKSQCSQVSNYHRLLSWEEHRGLHMDIFKVPVACSCHIQGYAYVYPPLGGSSIRGRSSTSNINERIDTSPGTTGRSRPPYQDIERPSRQPTTTAVTTLPPTTTSTEPPTTTPEPTTTTRRRYFDRDRLRPTRRRRPEATFPPYRPRPKPGQDDTADSPIKIPGLNDHHPEDLLYSGGFGDRIPADRNEIRRRLDRFDPVGSDSYQVHDIVPPPHHPHPYDDHPHPHPHDDHPHPHPHPHDEHYHEDHEQDERVNYGYHPIIDFFGN